MCIIIETNCVADVFREPTSPAFEPIFKWIIDKGGVLVTGGDNQREIFNVGSARITILNWFRLGRAHIIPDVDSKATSLSFDPNIRSNDFHVLALALLSGARVLCSTGDGDLCRDFKNIKVIPRPRGRIYRNASHRKLLAHSSSCRHNKRK